jgi:diguanylate cyclase (GGDEF)-like protein
MKNAKHTLENTTGKDHTEGTAKAVNPTSEIDCDGLADIVNNNTIRIYYQPIMDLKAGTIFGYEALCRGENNSQLYLPHQLFAASSCCDLEKDLEIACFKNALESAVHLGKDKKLFINVNPLFAGDLLREKSLLVLDGQLRKIVDDVINEVSECYVEFLLAHSKLFSGYSSPKLAIDNVRLGYQYPHALRLIRPEYVKFDRTIIEAIGKGDYEKKVASLMIEHAHSLGAKTIAVGVETMEELETVVNLNFDYVQGYLLVPPAPCPTEVDGKIVESVLKLENNRMKKQAATQNVQKGIGDIARHNPPIKRNTLVSQAQELLQNEPRQGLVVVDGNKPVGLVMKSDLYYHLGGHYGVSLYSKRPVELIMDKQPLIVDASLSLEAVSKFARRRQEAKLYDLIIVSKGAEYVGTVSVMELLMHLTDLQIQSAAAANPLTGLPGNLVIEDRLKDLVNKKVPFTVLYMDLDNFKSFNDKYGFEHGDRAIRLTASIISDALTQHGSSEIDFLGHIGGDDFIVITQPEKAEALSKYIIAELEEKVRTLYHESDLMCGYISVLNRKGKQEKFPIMSISIAVVDNSDCQFQNYLEIGEVAAHLKKKAKAVEGSVCIADRRHVHRE